ncbi:DDE-type integrase/transposase/recombinase, partial [Jannaschia formosa]|uniref:DDE-type integrase/transposase/recombinase n=1 Tax=Jannaschia formosa TaxID=2259592 RepID=UPI001FD72522
AGCGWSGPTRVWCADITYLPMRRGFLYLLAIMDWSTRKVLAWRISNTLEADFCVEALNEAIHRFGPPEIMNTDQGAQFTSFAWTDRLKRVGTRISMDGKGRCIDNIFIERLWRSLKYECVYLHAWETGKTDGRLARSPLKGTLGDALHAVLCGAGHNIRLILAHLRALFAEILAALLRLIGNAAFTPTPPKRQIARAA